MTRCGHRVAAMFYCTVKLHGYRCVLYYMPSFTHVQPFPPFIQGQVPVPLSQKSPFVGSNLPTSTTSAPVISTIMRPSPGTAGEGGKNQSSPVASSTPQAATGAAAKTQTSEGTCMLHLAQCMGSLYRLRCPEVHKHAIYMQEG